MNELTRNLLRFLAKVTPLSGALIIAAGCSAAQAVEAEKTLFRPEQCNPVRVAIFQDKSLSIFNTRTPEFQGEDLQPLIELFSKCGGELALGLIGDREFESRHELRGKSLSRLTIETPPESPPIPDFKYQNPLIQLAKSKSFKEEQIRYQQAMVSWKRRVEGGIAQFKKEMKDLLEIPADARNTDILDALARADLFLQEPTHHASIHKFLILITDGQHDSSKAANAPRLKSQAEFIVINGAGHLGILKNLQPLQFETVKSATKFIVSTVGREAMDGS